MNGHVLGLNPAKAGLIYSTKNAHWNGAKTELLKPLTTGEPSSMVEMEPRQRWAVTVTPQAKQMTIVPLSAQTRAPIKRPLCPDVHIQQVLAVNGGHLVIVGHSGKTGTQLQLWNRRGMYLTSLDLGISLGQLTPMRQPHQWMAIDIHAPQTVIFLTLKPLRITRMRLDICPTLMLDLPWGYLFGNAEGRILLLDRDLYPIGGIEGPAGTTAITPLSSHELLVATWQNESSSGALHCLDLHGFDLDMIF